MTQLTKNILTLALLLFAQDILLSQGQTGDFEIGFNPSSLPFHEPRISINFEKSTGTKTSLNLALGFGNEAISQLYYSTNGTSSLNNNYHFFEVRPEFRYYIPFFTIPAYISCEAFFLYLKKTDYNDSFNTYNTYININYERADFTKEKYGLTIIGGLKPYIFNGNYYAEMFGGIGIANRITNFKNVITTEEEFDHYRFFDAGYHTLGRKVVFNMTIGFRLGFIAKQRSKSTNKTIE